MRFVLLCILLLGSGCNRVTTRGLTIDGGHVTRRGAPYRGIGVNYFDAFYRTLQKPADVSYR